MKHPVRVLRWLFIAFLMLPLSACDNGPAFERIASDLETALAAAAPPGLLSLQTVDVTEIRRAGGENARGQRTVRFAAHVRANRDTSFAAWDEYNAATLAAALGAQPSQIGGLGRTNKAGDLLTIPGAAIYSHGGAADNAWRFRGFVTAKEPSSRAPSGFAMLRSLVATAGVKSAAWKIVSHHLHWPPTRALALVTRAADGVAIAAGPAGSDRWKVAEALQRQDNQTAAVFNMPAADSVESIRRVRDGTATAAIVDSDTAILASTGTYAFASAGAYPGLRAAASLFPKPVHVIVNADSKVNSVADLRGKRTLVVTSTPGTTRVAVDVLRAHRLPMSDVRNLTVPSIADAMVALAVGNVDAVIVAAAIPQPAMIEAAPGHRFRLLSLDSDAIALLTTGETHYVALSIPSRSYPGQQSSIATVAVTALVVADHATPPDEINRLLATMLGPVDYFKLGSSAGALISTRTAELGIPLPLHPGAETFFNARAATP
jgi:TRAP transporter TAXI family solute receptor